MSSKIKIVRNAYLYIASLISLLFIAIGCYTLLNTALKFYLFPKAEKGGYSRCEYMEPAPTVCDENGLNCKPEVTPDSKEDKDQKKEECYSEERQKNVADALTMIIIALPIFLFHWRLVRREKDTE